MGTLELDELLDELGELDELLDEVDELLDEVDELLDEVDELLEVDELGELVVVVVHGIGNGGGVGCCVAIGNPATILSLGQKKKSS